MAKRPLRIKQIEKIGRALIALDEDGSLWVIPYFETSLLNVLTKKTANVEWRPLLPPARP